MKFEIKKKFTAIRRGVVSMNNAIVDSGRHVLRRVQSRLLIIGEYIISSHILLIERLAKDSERVGIRLFSISPTRTCPDAFIKEQKNSDTKIRSVRTMCVRIFFSRLFRPKSFRLRTTMF